jgi:ABC-type dipeptide/oligopeptide/nickel transport system permease subunit
MGQPRVSLFVGLAATVLTIVIGSIVGIVAGFFGGRTERGLMRVTEWFLVIPFLPLAIVLASCSGGRSGTSSSSSASPRGRRRPGWSGPRC